MKRIHIHFSKLTYPDNTEDKVLHTIEEVNKAICNEQEDIHTTALARAELLTTRFLS